MVPDTVCLEKVLHGGGNFNDMCFEREMSGIEELNLRVRYVFPKCFCSRRNEERIVLAPDRQQRRFRLAEIFLKFRIQLHVRRVIQKQVELNLFVPRAFKQCSVQRVRLRRNPLRIRYTFGVLPARPSGCQNALAENVPILCRWCTPVLTDRTPCIAQAFFVSISILRDYGVDFFWMSHRQAETGWC